MPSADRRQAHNSHEKLIAALTLEVAALRAEVERPLVDRLLELGIEPKPAVAAERRRRMAEEANRLTVDSQWRQQAAKACSEAEARNAKAFAKADTYAASVMGSMMTASEAVRVATLKMHRDGIAELERQNARSDPFGEYSDGGKVGR